MTRSTSLLATFTLILCTLLAAPALATKPPQQDQLAEIGFDSVMQDYEDCHWQRAFDGFARLADAGDPDAARIALLMVRYGPSLYGQTFGVSAAQTERWRGAATRTARLSR